MVAVAAPQAFIFDMDGVIIDSTRAHTEAWRQYLLAHGITLPDLESRMLGRHNDEIVRDFFGAAAELPEDVIRKHGSAKEQVFREMVEPVFDTHLVAGVLPFLSRHPEIPAAVATNAERANVDFVLDRAGIRNRFRAVVTGDDGARPKPWPDIYLRAAELLGVPPQSCLVFEDSVTGVTAARAAGMQVAGVLTTLADLANVDLSIRDFQDPRLDEWLTRYLSLSSRAC